MRFLCALSTRVKSGKNAGLGTGVTLLGEVWASLHRVISVKRGKMTLRDTTSISHRNGENEVFFFFFPMVSGTNAQKQLALLCLVAC